MELVTRLSISLNSTTVKTNTYLSCEKVNDDEKILINLMFK